MWFTIFAQALYSAGALGVYTGGDTSGCGKPHADNATEAWSLMSSGRNRTYFVHVPENYSADDQYQTIVGFHGRGASGLYFEIDTGLSEAQFTGETIMVYPDGVNRNWAGASYSTLSIEEDLEFVWDLLAKVRKDYCVDSARIYATGHSNGGGLVNLIACNATVGAEFAAFAPVSGAFYENSDDQGDCEPARNSTPILEIHGGDDQIIPYDGGKGRGGELPSIPDWLEQWAKRDGCDDEQSEKIFNGAVEHVTWSCNSKESVVQHYKVNKGQHAWAATDPNLSQEEYDESPIPINASAIVPQFLKKFERPSADDDLNESTDSDAEDVGSRDGNPWASGVVAFCAFFVIATCI